MRVWQLDFELDEYDNLEPINKNDWDKLIFDGDYRKKTWVPIPIKKMECKDLSDAPGLNSSVLVLNEKALNILLDLISQEVEVLPLDFKGDKYYAINVTSVLDCIDYEKAEFKKFSNSGRIMRFISYSFRENVIRGKNIFKISDEPKRKPFVSDNFKDKVEMHNLKGFKFKLVWMSNDELSKHEK